MTAELYPTAVRATAQGITYNVGRVASAAAPWIVGGLTQITRISRGALIAAGAYALAAVFWIFIPETAGGRFKVKVRLRSKQPHELRTYGLTGPRSVS